MKPATYLCLTVTAGYVDTATFMAAGGLFAAHVTGNFVVFGAALAQGVGEHDYVKLIAFPVFVISVMLGALIYGKTNGKRFGGAKLLLLLQGLLFLATAAISNLAPNLLPVSWLALIVVFAMGLQNALHRYLPGPMTTVMTGTVMNWSASKAEKLFSLPAPEGKVITRPMTRYMITAFGLGCVVSGFITLQLGLAAVALPGMLVIALAFYELSEISA